MSGRSRAKELVTEARRTARIVERLRAQGTPAPDLEAVLDATYRDLGRLLVHDADVVALLAPLLPELVEAAVAEGFTDELPAPGAESWYEPDPTDPRGEEPFFSPTDFVGAGELPVSDALRVPADSDDEHELDVETPELLAARAELPGSGLGAWRAPGGSRSAWMAELEELLELLRAPFDLDDPTELGVEASRVQWASSELATRTANLPDDVVIGLLGLLSARAQHLRHRLDVDVGARRSLERLERFRSERNLPLVTGLLPTPVPDTSSWSEDAERWWALFWPHGDGA